MKYALGFKCNLQSKEFAIVKFDKNLPNPSIIVNKSSNCILKPSSIRIGSIKIHTLESYPVNL